MGGFLLVSLARPLFTLLVSFVVYFFLVRYMRVGKINAEGVFVRYPIQNILFILIIIPLVIALIITLLADVLSIVIQGVIGIIIFVFFMRNDLKSAGANRRQIVLVIGGFFGIMILGAIIWNFVFPLIAPFVCREDVPYFIQTFFFSDCFSESLKAVLR